MDLDRRVLCKTFRSQTDRRVGVNFMYFVVVSTEKFALVAKRPSQITGSMYSHRFRTQEQQRSALRCGRKLSVEFTENGSALFSCDI